MLMKPRLTIARGLALALMLAALAPSAPADVIHLKDGSKLEGDITKTADGWTVRDASGKVTNLKADQVKSLEARREVTTDAVAARLASLRRSAESMDDPAKAVERYQAFIKQHAGTPVAEEAINDLKVWEDRIAQGITKVGDRWLSPAEREEARQEALEAAAQARELLAQGKVKEAAPVLESALAKDPQSPAAHYLKGLLYYRQDQLVPARKSFEAVLAQLPDHAPTLNNLGVVLFLTRQQPAAMNYYGQAMLTSPGNRRVLDNVAEALHALPEEYRASAPVKKAVKLFNEQDNALQARLVQQDQYRWGSTWVTGEELDKLQEMEQKVKDKLERLQEEFDATQDRIEQIEDDVADTQRTLRRIEANSYTRDAWGRQVRTPLPRVYYDLADDIQDLKGEREDELRKIDKLRRQAKAVQKELPVPRYSGLQRLFDIDAAPLLPDGDRTMPAPPVRAGGDDGREPAIPRGSGDPDLERAAELLADPLGRDEPAEGDGTDRSDGANDLPADPPPGIRRRDTARPPMPR